VPSSTNTNVVLIHEVINCVLNNLECL
jgi:hypothetical protein